MIIVKNDENLPIINKTKHTTKGEKKVQDGRTQVLANEELFKRGRTARGTWEQIKDLNP
jgi:hypothetical protein